MSDIYKLDDKLDQLLEDCVNKERKFRKSCKPKKKPNHKLFEQLMDEDLKKKGYIKYD